MQENEKIHPLSPSGVLAEAGPPGHSAKRLVATDFSEADLKLFFWGNVQIKTSEGCWIWSKKTPTFTIRRTNFVAQRISFAIKNGCVERGVQLVNSCGDKSCVNPSHICVRLPWMPRRSEYLREWRKKNHEKSKAGIALWRIVNRKKVMEYNKKTYLKNSHKWRPRRNAYARKKYATDPLFRLKRVLRARLRDILKAKGYPKTFSAYRVLGCTAEFLKQHLEVQFSEGMSWSNHGEWEIDHIIPLGTAKSADEIERLSHYTNLQPLWRAENRSKSAGGTLRGCQTISQAT